MKYIDKTGAEPTRLRDWKIYHDNNLQLLYSTVSGDTIWEYLDNNPTIDGTTTNNYSKYEIKSVLLAR